MALKAMSDCYWTRLWAVVILVFLFKPPSVSCSRPIPGASGFHIASTWYQNQGRLLNSSIPHSVRVQPLFTPPIENQGQPQTSTSSGLNTDSMKDQEVDSELPRHSKHETTGDEIQRGFRKAPSFQMLPRNTRPPPRGPSPGSNRLGNPS